MRDRNAEMREAWIAARNHAPGEDPSVRVMLSAPHPTKGAWSDPATGGMRTLDDHLGGGFSMAAFRKDEPPLQEMKPFVPRKMPLRTKKRTR